MKNKDNGYWNSQLLLEALIYEVIEHVVNLTGVPGPNPGIGKDVCVGHR